MEEKNQEKDELTLLKEQNEKLKSDCANLNNLAIQFSQQVQKLQQDNKALHEALTENDKAEFYTRLNFLFKVVEQNTMFSVDFVGMCISEIEESLSKDLK